MLCEEKYAPNEKSIPALKINILWDMTNSIPYLVPNQFQELVFLPINRKKIPAQAGRNQSPLCDIIW
jgi:hypothetical protein